MGVPMGTLRSSRPSIRYPEDQTVVSVGPYIFQTDPQLAASLRSSSGKTASPPTIPFRLRSPVPPAICEMDASRRASRTRGINDVRKIRRPDRGRYGVITLVCNQIPRALQADDLRLGGRHKTPQRFLSDQDFYSRFIQHISNPAR